MNKHTPGPWSVNPPFFKNWDSRCIYGVTEYVACVGGVENCRETIDANARLIAAAPELLEALEFLVFAFESCDETGYVDGHGFIDTEDLKEKARQAIAKAKGE